MHILHVVCFVVQVSYAHLHPILVRVLTMKELSQQWQSCYDAFLRSFSRSGSEHSAVSYRCMLNNYFGSLKRDVSQATRSDVEDYMWEKNAAHKRNPGEIPTPGTRNLRKSVVTSFYKFASEYVPPGQYEPLYTGKLPTLGIKTAQRDIDYRGMSPEELERLFSVIDRDTLIGKRDYAFFLTLYLTARRLREIADLEYGDIRWETIIDGSERRQAWVYKFRGKGHKRQVDSAELSQVAKSAIDDYLQASGRLPLAPDDPIFTSTLDRVGYDPYKPIDSTAIARRMKLYCEYAGLDSRRLSPHSFRHSSAQHRLANGESLADLNYLLRHRSMDDTMRYARGLISRADPGLHGLELRFTT